MIPIKESGLTGPEMVEPELGGGVGEGAVLLLQVNTQTFVVRGRVAVVGGTENQIQTTVVVHVGEFAKDVALIKIAVLGGDDFRHAIHR